MPHQQQEEEDSERLLGWWSAGGRGLTVQSGEVACSWNWAGVTEVSQGDCSFATCTWGFLGQQRLFLCCWGKLQMQLHTMLCGWGS